MEKVVIAIATYRRPKMLANALKSLEDLSVPDGCEVLLLVSDNDSAGAAKPVVEAARTTLQFPVSYFQEDQPGIVPNRNRLLTEALERDADYLAFFDDDETVDPAWLLELLKTIKTFKASAVWGKTIYTLPKEAPEWLQHRNFFGGDQPATGTKRRGASTNNVLIDMRFLGSNNLRFDPRFNDIGGSDSFLFRQFWDHGGSVVSSREAITYEDVPASRANEAWILRRAFKNAHTEYRRALIRKGKLAAYLLALGYGFWLGVCYYLSIALYPFKAYDFKVFNRRRRAKMRGLAEALRGGTHHEYETIHGG